MYFHLSTIVLERLQKTMGSITMLLLGKGAISMATFNSFVEVPKGWINGHDSGIDKNWRYQPYRRPISGGYVKGYACKIWPNIWYSTSSVLGSWKSPIE